MKSGIVFEQGEIVIVPFPFSDLRGIKQRPVLIISKNEYNQSCEDVITCGITSDLKNSQFSVLIEDNNLTKGNIPVKSRIRIDKLLTLEKNVIKKKIGKINKDTLEKVREEFFSLI